MARRGIATHAINISKRMKRQDRTLSLPGGTLRLLLDQTAALLPIQFEVPIRRYRLLDRPILLLPLHKLRPSKGYTFLQSLLLTLL